MTQSLRLAFSTHYHSLIHAALLRPFIFTAHVAPVSALTTAVSFNVHSSILAVIVSFHLHSYRLQLSTVNVIRFPHWLRFASPPDCTGCSFHFIYIRSSSRGGWCHCIHLPLNRYFNFKFLFVSVPFR